MNIDIREVTSGQEIDVNDINRYLKILLDDENAEISDEDLTHLIESKNSHLFIAYDDRQNPLGMLTIGNYISPTGTKGWIEDVVVDTNHQGKGISKELINHAITYARENKIQILSLTSNPNRAVANHLYANNGFQLKDTNVYKINF